MHCLFLVPPFRCFVCTLCFVFFGFWEMLIFVFFELKRSSFLYSFRYWVETVCTHCNRRANIKTYTTWYYISVLLASVVWILLICHFSTVFPEIFDESSNSNIYISFWASMCSTFSLLVIEWKLYAHTASDLQTSKLA